MPQPPPDESSPGEPPYDAEQWSDDQWLAWLAATDEAGGDDGEPPRLSRWRERPSSLVLGAAMLGLRDAIYGPPDDEVVVVVDASGDPSDDDQPEVRLDPDHPERSEVVVRRQRPRRRRDRG